MAQLDMEFKDTRGRKIVVAIGLIGVAILAGLWWMTRYAQEHTQPKENLLEFAASARIGYGARLIRDDLDWTGDSKPDFLFAVAAQHANSPKADTFRFKRLLLISTPKRKPLEVLCILDSIILGKANGFALQVQSSGHGFAAQIDRSGVPTLAIVVIGKDGKPTSDSIMLRYDTASQQFLAVE